MADAHPDRGGSNEAFIRARQAYRRRKSGSATSERMRSDPKRQARCRRRRRQGCRVLPVPVDFIAVSEVLADEGRIDADQVEDTDAVAAAVAEIVQEWLVTRNGADSEAVIEDA